MPRKVLHSEIARRSDCPVSVALDLLGDKWSLLIIRDMLLFDKHYFGEFLAATESISTNLLTDRLRRLEKVGIVTRSVDPQNAAKIRYALTGMGVDLLPVMLQLIGWGGKYFETAAPASFLKRLRSDPQGVEAKFRKKLAANASTSPVKPDILVGHNDIS